MPDTVALVARDPDTRAHLSGYLEEAGFRVRDTADASQAVWVIEKDQNLDAVASEIVPWLGAHEARHAVIVTWRPTTMRVAIGSVEARLSILIAPVFPWQLVDALRQREGEP